MPGSTLIIRTPRLDIVATTLARLDAELTARDSAAPHPLAVLLDARVPASWPPGTYDVDAMRFFRERLIADGPAGVWLVRLVCDHSRERRVPGRACRIGRLFRATDR